MLSAPRFFYDGSTEDRGIVLQPKRETRQIRRQGFSHLESCVVFFSFKLNCHQLNPIVDNSSEENIPFSGTLTSRGNKRHSDQYMNNNVETLIRSGKRICPVERRRGPDHTTDAMAPLWTITANSDRNQWRQPVIWSTFVQSRDHAHILTQTIVMMNFFFLLLKNSVFWFCFWDGPMKNEALDKR